jgi:hypothetical protein
MPWLVSAGHCVSLQDAAIHRVPLPEDAAAAVCRGSFGDWLALVPATGRPFLLNAFTMERIKLPRQKKKPTIKFVLSSVPDSKSCTVAAILDNEDDSNYSKRSKIVVCHVGRGDSWRTITMPFNLHDIIFFEGKLHALDENGRVHVFQDGNLQRDKPWRPPQYTGRDLRFGNSRLHLVVLHGRLRMVCRALGNSRLPGRTHFTSNVGVFELVPGCRPQPVKDLYGHAIFVGDACCGAYPAGTSSSGGGMIRKNQICFVDDERNLSSLAACCLRPFRQLQSYDVRNGCLHTFRPAEPSSGPPSGTWRRVTVQRFPHSAAWGPPAGVALSWEERQLRDVANCLGATYPPSYTTHKNRKTGRSRVSVRVSVPRTAAIRKERAWRFTLHRPSAMEARQAAAYKATTFLRSRFRSILNDSPWSSVPHYHRYISEIDEKEEANSDLDSDDNDLFDYRRWYGGY